MPSALWSTEAGTPHLLSWASWDERLQSCFIAYPPSCCGSNRKLCYGLGAIATPSVCARTIRTTAERRFKDTGVLFLSVCLPDPRQGSVTRERTRTKAQETQHVFGMVYEILNTRPLSCQWNLACHTATGQGSTQFVLKGHSQCVRLHGLHGICSNSEVIIVWLQLGTASCWVAGFNSLLLQTCLHFHGAGAKAL